DDATAAKCNAGNLLLAERQAREPAPITGHDLGCDHDVARFQRRIETPGNPKGDHAADGRRIQYGEQRPQLMRIACTTDDSHSGPSSDAGLLNQTCHNQDRPRVHPPRGQAVPRPQIHIPTPTTLLLVSFKFRYRASAQSGKNSRYPWK